MNKNKKEEKEIILKIVEKDDLIGIIEDIDISVEESDSHKGLLKSLKYSVIEWIGKYNLILPDELLENIKTWDEK